METLKLPRDIDPRDLGVHVLVTCENPIVDIIAIHGLGATPSTTWTKAPDPHTENNSTISTEDQINSIKHRVNWLSNPKMLPACISNCRIMTFNYDSNWYGGNSVSVRLDHVADSMRRQVGRIRRTLIKPQALKILEATIGVLLLGTPHRGTDNVTSRELLQRIIDAGTRGESASLKALQADNEMVLDTVRGFATTAREKKIPVHCFFEQRASEVSKMFGDNYKDFIVSEDSAILDGCESYGLPLDHYQLNKFSNPEDGNWRELSGVITDICEDMQENSCGLNGSYSSYQDLDQTSTIVKPVNPFPAEMTRQVNNFSGSFSAAGKTFYGGNFDTNGGPMNF